MVGTLSWTKGKDVCQFVRNTDNREERTRSLSGSVWSNRDKVAASQRTHKKKNSGREKQKENDQMTAASSHSDLGIKAVTSPLGTRCLKSPRFF